MCSAKFVHDDVLAPVPIAGLRDHLIGVDQCSWNGRFAMMGSPRATAAALL